MVAPITLQPACALPAWAPSAAGLHHAGAADDAGGGCAAGGSLQHHVRQWMGGRGGGHGRPTRKPWLGCTLLRCGDAPLRSARCCPAVALAAHMGAPPHAKHLVQVLVRQGPKLLQPAERFWGPNPRRHDHRGHGGDAQRARVRHPLDVLAKPSGGVLRDNAPKPIAASLLILVVLCVFGRAVLCTASPFAALVHSSTSSHRHCTAAAATIELTLPRLPIRPLPPVVLPASTAFFRAP